MVKRKVHHPENGVLAEEPRRSSRRISNINYGESSTEENVAKKSRKTKVVTEDDVDRVEDAETKEGKTKVSVSSRQDSCSHFTSICETSFSLASLA